MKPLVAIFLPLVVAFWASIAWCVDRWNAPTEYFTHCWLLPAVAAVVIWRRRSTWRLAPRQPDVRGWWLLGPALALHACGAALMIDSWSAASLVLAVPGAALLALGRRRLAGNWPVVWLVLFAVPAPIYVEGRLAFELKEVAVAWGSWVGNLFGADVVRRGDQLVPSGLEGSLFVADACSGLRSLLAMMTLAYCMAFFTGPSRWWRRMLLLGLAAPLAVFANVARIGALCLLARWFGVGFAEGTGHSIANVVEWLALLATLLTLDGWLSRSNAAGTVDAVQQSDAAAAQVAARVPRSTATLWLVCGPLLWLSLARPYGGDNHRAERLPAALAGFTLQPRDAAEERSFQQSLPRWRELLGTDDFVYRRYRDDEQRFINLVAVFHDANWKSVHPPRICIEGSNMAILEDELVEVAWMPAGARLGRITAQSRGYSTSFVTLSVFGTSDWVSGDYWEFFWHHLPRAILRANESGFLLRVESPVRPGESADDAAGRCEEFLRSLLPSAQELLR